MAEPDVSSLGLQVDGHLVPGLRRLLGMAPLGLVHTGAIVAGALGPFVVSELEKASIQSSAASRKKAAGNGRAHNQSRAARNAMAERSTSLSASLSTSRPAMPEAAAPARDGAAAPG